MAVISEPDQGLGSIDAILTSAQHRLDLTMYELVDPSAEAILAADAERGVTVRVVLDHNREAAANAAAYGYLNSHGVDVRWAPPSYEATHEKAAVIDAGYPAATALIMTMNLTSRYYATTRDFAVIDRLAPDVAAIETVFGADFAGQTSAATPPGLDLVWSPGSEAALVGLINSAGHRLSVENEEMSSRAVVRALEGAAARGVDVRVTMTEQSSDRSELAALAAANAGVHLFPDRDSALYIHAKVVIVDAGLPDARAFVGSENFSTASLSSNRELGLITSDPAVVTALAAVLATDYADASG